MQLFQWSIHGACPAAPCLAACHPNSISNVHVRGEGWGERGGGRHNGVCIGHCAPGALFGGRTPWTGHYWQGGWTIGHTAWDTCSVPGGSPGPSSPYPPLLSLWPCWAILEFGMESANAAGKISSEGLLVTWKETVLAYMAIDEEKKVLALHLNSCISLIFNKKAVMLMRKDHKTEAYRSLWKSVIPSLNNTSRPSIGVLFCQMLWASKTPYAKSWFWPQTLAFFVWQKRTL